jgi:hypothetical protein
MHLSPTPVENATRLLETRPVSPGDIVETENGAAENVSG